MMNAPGRSASAAMLFISVFTRLFWGMAADAPVVHISAWICPIVGLLLYLPFALFENRCAQLAAARSPWEYLKQRNPAWLLRGAEILLAFALLLDCAFNMRLMAGIANVLALNSMPVFLLLLPLGLLLTVSILLGTEAEGNSARLWNLLLPVLFLIIFIVHLPSYEPRWLSPILGGGFREILRGGIYCGGGIALLSAQWMLSVPDRNQRSPLIYATLATAAASMQLAALQMLSPSLTGVALSRAGRIGVVLSNGRTAMPLQMLLMLVSYGGILHLIAAEGAACAAFLSHTFPTAPRGVFAVSISVAATALSASILAVPAISSSIFQFYYPAVAVLALLLTLAACCGRRSRKCVKQY